MQRTNLFREKTPAQLVECYRSFIRLKMKKGHSNEVMDAMIEKYSKYHEDEKVAYILAEADMQYEIARRYTHIVDSFNYIV